MAHLSKSDFKVAHTCPTKLWYKKHAFPTSTDQNEYMKMLADGGFMFGKLAMLLFPEGIEITGSYNVASAQTEELLCTHQIIILFEPAIQVNNQLVRVDVLQKNGNQIKVIEVKSKSFDSTKMNAANYWFKPDMKPYIEDVAYQTKVVREKNPDAVVTSPNSRYRNLDVIFNGDDTLLDSVREAYAHDNLFVKLIPVNEQVAVVMPEIIHAANVFIDSVLSDTRIITPPSCNCKGCEYTVTDNEHPQSGFDICWGELAKVEPHILTLGQLGNVNKRNLLNTKKALGEKGCIDELIDNKKVSLHDIPVELVSSTKEGEQYYNDRPLYQLTQTQELILPNLKHEMSLK